MDIAGQPRLTIAGRDGLVSARAVAGEQSTVPIIVANDGTAPADNIELSGCAWENGAAAKDQCCDGMKLIRKK